MTSIKQICSTMTSANKYISNIINSFNEGDLIENRLIKELVEYHPTKQIDVINVEWFKMKKRKPFNSLALFYKNKNNSKEDDISWKLCIRNLYGRYNNDNENINRIIKAFRNESHIGSKKKYLIDNTCNINGIRIGKCINCNKEGRDITTDHCPPQVYKIILNTFIADNNINLCNINVFENEQNEMRVKDKELASKWLKYHDSKAQYRLLCKSCNSHFGSYGF